MIFIGEKENIMGSLVLREFREMPFCWQDKSILRKINLEASRKEISAIRNCYVTLTEIASNQENEKISIFLFDIAKISGLSEKTISKCLDFLVNLGVVYMEPQERGPDGRYKNKEIWLVSNKETVGKLKKTSKKSGKKIEETSPSKLSDNKETNIEDNIESNIENSVEGESEKKEIPSTHKNLDFINGMRDVEIRGNNWLIKWNSLTSREDLMNSGVKKELFGIMKNVPFETFEKRVANFKKILDLIEVHSLKPFLYFDVWDRDFEKFIKSINKFYGTPNEIFCKLSHREYKSRVLRLISKPQKAQEEEKEEKKPLSEAEKKERQKRLRAIQEKILSN